MFEQTRNSKMTASHATTKKNGTRPVPHLCAVVEAGVAERVKSVGVWFGVWWSGGYLKQGALVPPDLLQSSQGDAHDGEQGDPPAHHVRPGREHVLSVVCRAVLRDAGHQDDLR